MQQHREQRKGVRIPRELQIARRMWRQLDAGHEDSGAAQLSSEADPGLSGTVGQFPPIRWSWISRRQSAEGPVQRWGHASESLLFYEPMRERRRGLGDLCGMPCGVLLAAAGEVLR